MSPAGSGNISQFFCFPKTTTHEAINFALPQDAKWHNIDLDLTAISRWKGYIGNIRIDPGCTPGTTVEIDSAFLLQKGTELISIIDTNLPHGEIGIAFSHTFSETNSIGERSWELVDGNLPSGLVLNPAGLLSGTPTVSGPSVFSIEVNDKIWTDSKEFSIEVIPEIGIVISNLLSIIGIVFVLWRK